MDEVKRLEPEAPKPLSGAHSASQGEEVDTKNESRGGKAMSDDKNVPRPARAGGVAAAIRAAKVEDEE